MNERVPVNDNQQPFEQFVELVMRTRQLSRADAEWEAALVMPLRANPAHRFFLHGREAEN